MLQKILAAVVEVQLLAEEQCLVAEVQCLAELCLAVEG